MMHGSSSNAQEDKHEGQKGLVINYRKKYEYFNIMAEKLLSIF
jgi:hypothetical protein